MVWEWEGSAQRVPLKPTKTIQGVRFLLSQMGYRIINWTHRHHRWSSSTRDFLPFLRLNLMIFMMAFRGSMGGFPRNLSLSGLLRLLLQRFAFPVFSSNFSGPLSITVDQNICGYYILLVETEIDSVFCWLLMGPMHELVDGHYQMRKWFRITCCQLT